MTFKRSNVISSDLPCCEMLPLNSPACLKSIPFRISDACFGTCRHPEQSKGSQWEGQVESGQS